MLLEFGSRSGSLFALILFGAVFAALGWAVGRQMRHPGLAVLTGLLVFGFPVALIYVSSLGGFYEARAREEEVGLHFLLSPFIKTLPREDIREVRAVHAFRLRWRLEIITRDGRRHKSATWNRIEVKEAAERLHQWLSEEPGPSRGALTGGPVVEVQGVAMFP